MEAVVQWIIEGRYSIIALQFPEEMLDVCVDKTEKMERLLIDAGHSAQCHILADSAYDSASVDGIAAEHIHADCLIHFGEASMAKQSQIPTFYVFERDEIDLKRLSNLKSEMKSTDNDCSLSSIVFIEASLEQHRSTIIRQLTSDEDGLRIQMARLQTEEDGGGDEVEDGMVKHEMSGYAWTLPVGETMDRCRCLWIGCLDSKTLLQLQLHFATAPWILFAPQSSTLKHGLLPETERMLKRRAFLVEKAREAQIVGLLISSPGIGGTLDVINKLKQLALSVDKHVYEIVVAKPNPAKLANIPEVEVWVSVCDPHSMILDCKEFLAPLITPFEAYTAWTDGHLSNRQYRYHLPLSFQSQPTPMDIQSSTSRSLTVRQKFDMVSVEESPAESFHRRRCYQGLDARHDQASDVITEGQSGIPSRYSHEPTV